MISSKRGQFYLVAAIIIALVVFSLATISNYAKENKEEPIVFDLKKELNLETGKVVDFAIYNKSDTNYLIENWTKVYVESQKGKDVENWVFVYGTPGVISVLTFAKESAGKTCIETSATKTCYDAKHTTTTNQRVDGTEIIVTLEGFSYNFNMTSGKNFAFVINKEGYVASTPTAKNGEETDDD